MPDSHNDPAEPQHIGAILPTIAHQALAGKPQPDLSPRPREIEGQILDSSAGLRRERGEIVSLRFRRKASR